VNSKAEGKEKKRIEKEKESYTRTTGPPRKGKHFRSREKHRVTLLREGKAVGWKKGAVGNRGA